jgi:hypothetical protein
VWKVLPPNDGSFIQHPVSFGIRVRRALALTPLANALLNRHDLSRLRPGQEALRFGALPRFKFFLATAQDQPVWARRVPQRELSENQDQRVEYRIPLTPNPQCHKECADPLAPSETPKAAAH